MIEGNPAAFLIVGVMLLLGGTMLAFVLPDRLVASAAKDGRKAPPRGVFVGIGLVELATGLVLATLSLIKII